MAAYTFGRFDANFMPRARLMQERTGRRINLRRVKQYLEDLGIFRNFRDGVIMTGIGQMLAKALIYSAAGYTLTAESVYLSALVANTLLAEMKRFNEESVKTILLETIVRHKRISSTVREWQKTAPKLYLRDIPIFYSWEDAVKDVVSTLKKEDFRFTI
jgi:phosphoribosylaminoimidazole-succinocarboxamide synthase